MHKVYNLLTQKTKITPSTKVLLDSDMVLYEEFKSNIAGSVNYREARQSVIASLVDARVEKFGQSDTQEVVNKLVKLNNDHFQSHTANLSDQICSDLSDAYLTSGSRTSLTSPHQYLLDFMVQKISKMSDMDYGFLIEITNSWKEFVFFLLQPVFVAVLGVTGYVSQADYLISGNNLTQLFLTAKQKTMKLYVHQLLPDFTSIPVKNILLVSTIFITPILYTCYKAIYPSSAVIGSREYMKVPKINSPSFKNEYSKSLKEFGSFIHNLGGEIGDIIAQFTSGLGLGYAGRAQQNIGNLFENSNKDLESDESRE